MKNTLIVAYLIGIAGMVALILYDPTGDDVNQLLVSIMVLGSKFGVSQAFNIAYIGNVLLFPVTIVASTIGVCNIFSRVLTIIAPFIAELKPVSISQWIFVVVCGIALWASLSIRQN